MSRDWFKDDVNPKAREWEEMYRNRWQYDRAVRSVHGVNCTGSCSWMVYVKDGIVGWELQASDYPQFNAELPNYEPRGCQRGISTSWYQYSPIRVKYPYLRGALLDLWQEARSRHADPVDAWQSIVESPEARRSWVRSRGMGGFRRVAWDDVMELIAASILYTAKKYGPDRIIGFTPIPAMSMISYASGARFLNLLGGVVMSFYDWYCDLPPASPQVWGEQTDVHESADWYNAGYIIVCGSNLPMTRTPDAHFMVEARHRGAKVAVLSPDFSQVSKFADSWLPVARGHDGAFWMAVNHVILKEFYFERKTPYFEEYARKFTDLPFLVKLKQDGKSWIPGDFLRAGELAKGAGLEHGEWILCVSDQAGEVRIPPGSVGFRWSKEPGRWNLDMTDVTDGLPIDCRLSIPADNVRTIRFVSDGYGESLRNVPVQRVVTAAGEEWVATVFDLLAAHLGVSSDLEGDYPTGYGDDRPFTPAWQEKFTGLAAETVIRVAREWGENGATTEGRNIIIGGAGANHWYHNDSLFRAAITSLILTGSVGKQGGGLAYYVGQEKVVPIAPWNTVAMAHDWIKPSRLQNTPSFWYIHSGQWRYDRSFVEYFKPQTEEGVPVHAADCNVKAARLGWLPFFPQFDESSLEVVREAERQGAAGNEAVKARVVDRLKKGSLRFAIEDPDAPQNTPKVFLIWRGSAMAASAKGHEFFLKHLVGAPNASCTAPESAKGQVSEIAWREESPEGRLDLIVDFNFRMDSTAIYSDIVLPAASWYEKVDVNTTDLHSFINCMDSAVPPSWEAKSDWQAFALLARKVSEFAPRHFPEPIRDLMMTPLLHDTPDEIAQREVRDWKKGECEPVPGKTMPHLTVVERDYTRIHERFTTLGRGIEHLGGHGVLWDAEDVHRRVLNELPVVDCGGERRVSLADEETVANVMFAFAPETNGEMGHRAYQSMEKRVGKPLAHLAAGMRSARLTFNDIRTQPRRTLNSPLWSGLVHDGRSYSPFTTNVECGVPWRTLTGRQAVYLDHPWYREFGEGLPTFKHRLDPALLDETTGETGLVLNFLTPHGKWGIHSTFHDNLQMLTLSRGGIAIWINSADGTGADIRDNEWVEVYNANGVVVCRAILSARVAPGTSIMYHAPERTLGAPKSRRTGKQGGVHNSLTRIRLKPTLMLGGYGQMSYYFNYWGPTGVNRDTYVVVRKLREEP